MRGSLTLSHISLVATVLPEREKKIVAMTFDTSLVWK